MLISEIHYPASVNDALALLDEQPETILLAGGTEIAGAQVSRFLQFPQSIACIAKIPELKKTTRTEQFMEFGSCTSLTGLLSLGPGILPHPLAQAIQSIGNPTIRNIATLGGNLASRRQFMDLWPFLVCMDAQVEIRNRTNSHWANLFYLADSSSKPFFPEKSILTRVRIPLVEYSNVFYRKIGGQGFPHHESAVFVCMAEIQQNKIESFRLVFSGTRVFRLQEVELSLFAKKITNNSRELAFARQEYIREFSRSGFLKPAIFSSLVTDAFETLFGASM